jgi:hypothetical protein
MPDRTYANLERRDSRVELRHRLPALAAVVVAVLVFGAKFLAEHKMRRFHIVNLKYQPGFCPAPTLLLPANRLGTYCIY